MSQKTGLTVENLTKQYGKQTVLNQLNLKLEKGHIYGLLGRNGAGKSTLMKIISAQILWNGGKVELDGEKIWENQEKLSQICYVQEMEGAYQMGLSGMKVKDYLKMASLYFPNWDENYARQLVQEMNLPEKKTIKGLSKGMRSMVSAVVALASKAPYTLMDEPVAGLDLVAREYLYQQIMSQQEDRCFVISTHLVEEASSLVDRVLFLKDGIIVVDEETDTLVSQFWKLSGLTEEVEQLAKGLPVVHRTTLGRKTTLCLRLDERQRQALAHQPLVPMELAQVFLALCGGKETR